MFHFWKKQDSVNDDNSEEETEEVTTDDCMEKIEELKKKVFKTKPTSDNENPFNYIWRFSYEPEKTLEERVEELEKKFEVLERYLKVSVIYVHGNSGYKVMTAKKRRK